MTSQRLKHAIFVLVLAVIVNIPELAWSAEPDWKTVEAVLGKAGQMQPGGVFGAGCRGPTSPSP